MNCILALHQQSQTDMLAALRSGTLVQVDLVPAGFDPRVWALALLGQDPRATWTGPASYALAAAGGHQAEDETCYLLTPVRAPGGVVAEVVPLGRGRMRDVVEFLREALGGETVQIVPGDPPLLLVSEEFSGPPTLAGVDLLGARVDDLSAGPPALLSRVIEGSRQAFLELGGRVTHLVPSCPSPPARVAPLREAWLGLGPSALVGNGTDAQALAGLLGLRHLPVHTNDVRGAVEQVAGRDLVVLYLDAAQAQALGSLDQAFPQVPNLAAAWPAGGDGRVPVVWASRDGRALGSGVDLLAPLAVAKKSV